jgi:hypothetical protein
MKTLKLLAGQFCLSLLFAALATGQATTSGQVGASGSRLEAPGQEDSGTQAQSLNSGPEDGTTLELALALTAGKPPQLCVNKIKELFNEDKKANDKLNTRLMRILSPRGNAFCADYLLLNSSQYHAASRYVKNKDLADLEKKIELQILKQIKKMSQQTGSSSGTGGSTNLASKGIAANVLSIASEYGALTESTSGQTTTVNGTLAGVPVALMKKGIAEECSAKLLAATPCFNHAVVDYLSRISYSVSYDTSQNGQTISGTAVGSSTGTAQEVTASGNSRSINAVSGKWVLIQGPSSSKDIQTAVSKLGPKPAANVISALQPLKDKELAAGDAITNWQSDKAKQLAEDMTKDSSGKRAAANWSKMGTELVEKLGGPEDPAKITTDLTLYSEGAADSDVIKDAIELALAYSAYLGQEEDAAINVAKPALLTFEYDENRPANQPTNSVFRGIFQHKIGQEGSLTINGAISIYDSSPSSSIPGASRLRDAQFAMEADEPFSLNTALAGKVGMTLSEAFYFQDQTSPAILNVDPGSPVNGVSFTGLPSNATQIFAQKGNISVGQIKLSIGTGSNLKVPLSVTYSNRTELIVKPTWRAQIGVSYDLDSLFQGK